MELILDAFDASASTLRAQYERLRQLKEEGEDRDVKMDAFRALHDSFLSHTEKMTRELDALQSDEEREADDIEEEVAELEAELLMLTEMAEGRDAGGRALPPPAYASVEVYTAFAMHLGDFVARLTTLRDALRGLLSHPHPLEAGGSSLITWCGVMNRNAWAEKECELDSAWRDLEGKAGALGATSQDAFMSGARGLLDEVLALGKRAVGLVVNLQRSQERREKAVSQMEGHQRRLVVWCRQQQVNLDVLRDPCHIKEFCTSLLEHYKTMSTNYRVLLESAEPVLESEAVQERLLEANETWVHLQVNALERLRHTLFEVYAETLLEENVEEHRSFGSQVGPFLEELHNSLVATRDTASPLHERCAQLIEECLSLQKLLPEHDELCKNLLGFGDRVRMMREAYACFRAAALSRVTYLSSSAEVLAEAARRKEEFEGCVEELKMWTDNKARTDTWRDVREKVRDIRALLEREHQFIDQDRKKEE
ncbi:hypothetical protein TraAM80_09474 [Trypanosoma rangeli]|uniref:Uncharacterized protein n=1 Tax=Trypanosoma rangeli TaxID=5698 RepID=A0A422MV92_TRYRA|nr:uncharacterized protein TraAM80_09474 [Trypanosoma rangeli]RNE97148.1 hypothetical protein TraAM80_09474 [Trypanosoma rangeli]|eukprot:RNE97148.1 hypothetical protein TraAM80_09474 [Trypanosoma rangeli]